MSAPEISLLEAIAEDSRRASDLATVLCRLIREGGELGALEDRELELAGTIKTVRVIPREWLERLQKAVNLGAFERLTLDQIVERILLPPPDQD